ncbi:carboxypeptidase-like regulatory domain-containing protein [Ulvibacterium sp.]|uniref:carboxypeptidase-like regulatory domain-containing protein n=1 Tax=Ulvibacterium sp. TaxID=2665914 RepID=UPI003CC68849
MNRTLFLILYFLLSLGPVSAQQEFIQGKLLDAQTGEPVVFATIRVKDRAKGVISNQDGGFRIPTRFKELGDVLIISSMGYQKREIPIGGLSPEHINIIRLTPGVLNLSEAVVTGQKKRKLSARRIVRKALANMERNYPLNTFSTIGYYRDYQLKQGNYVNLNEAVLEVFDQGFSRIDSATTKVRIYDYKRNTDFERDTLAEDPYDYRRLLKIVDNAYLDSYGGNEFSILRVHDAIRNYKVGSYSFVDQLDADLLKNHSFSRDNNTYLNGEALYTVKFRKRHPHYSAFGILYVSHGDFAVHKMEYTLYDDRKRLPDRKLNRHQGRGQLIFEITTEYQRHDYGKMFLNYISFENSFILWQPPKFKVENSAIGLMKSPSGGIGGFRLELVFNRDPNVTEAEDVRNYLVKYKGKRLKIKTAGLVKNERKVFLLPDMTQKERKEILEGLFEAIKKKIDLNNLFSIDIKPILDLEGIHRLHEWKKRDYDQFREYFVQQVKPSTELPDDDKFMDKHKPIFEDQPIVKPDDFEEYWMNTPLK